MPDIPTTEPTAVTAGDTIRWTKALADYPANDGWTLAYKLRNGDSLVDVAATASGPDHAVAVTAAQSTLWPPGEYIWASFASKAGDRHEVARGRLTVRANFEAAESFDSRTHADRTLAALEAVIENRATKDQEGYRIGDRELRRIPVAELLKLRALYRSEVAAQRAAEDILAGRPAKNRFLTRFTRPN